MKELLIKTCGLDKVVTKLREIYVIDNVKIYIDKVEGLGKLILFLVPLPLSSWIEAKPVTLFLVVEDSKTEDVLNIIREHTKNFTLSHGGMFVTPITSFEGSF